MVNASPVSGHSCRCPGRKPHKNPPLKDLLHMSLKMRRKLFADLSREWVCGTQPVSRDKPWGNPLCPEGLTMACGHEPQLCVSVLEPSFSALTRITVRTCKPPSPHLTHNPSPTIRVHVAEDSGSIAVFGVDCVPAAQNLPFGQQFLAVPGFCANQRHQVE